MESNINDIFEEFVAIKQIVERIKLETKSVQESNRLKTELLATDQLNKITNHIQNIDKQRIEIDKKLNTIKSEVSEGTEKNEEIRIAIAELGNDLNNKLSFINCRPKEFVSTIKCIHKYKKNS